MTSIQWMEDILWIPEHHFHVIHDTLDTDPAQGAVRLLEIGVQKPQPFVRKTLYRRMLNDHFTCA